MGFLSESAALWSAEPEHMQQFGQKSESSDGVEEWRQSCNVALQAMHRVHVQPNCRVILPTLTLYQDDIYRADKLRDYTASTVVSRSEPKS